MEANKPVLLTVDDDPGVSRAVARDLRRRYGQDHRIVRAESGPQALEALREIKLRGDPVAVLLADYRMPEMSGLEFLEQAMDLFPHARRALLTAYADTDAAIQAINVIDLDHYLLKPWDPPDEKLYPVVDELIELWRTAEDKPVTATQVVGHRWSARSYEVRDFLARNSVSYRWLNADEPEGRGLLAAAGLDETSIPLVVTPEGDSLVDPSVEELAARVGLSTTPATDFYDTVIVGGGPAGLGAAVYAASEGLRTVMVERQATGGQAGQSSRIENYLGFPDGVSGAQLTDRARRQASKFGAEILDRGRRHRPGGARLVAGGPLRRRRRGRRPHRGAGHRGQLPHPGGARHRGAHRPRRLLRVDRDRGPDLRRRGRLRGRGRQRGRPGGRVPGTARPPGHHAGARATAWSGRCRTTSSARSATPATSRCGPAPAWSGPRARPPGAPAPAATPATGTVEEVHGGLPVRVHRRGALHRMARRGGRTRPQGLRASPAPTCSRGGRRPPGWPLDRDPYYLEASVPGVFAAGDARANSVKRVASAVGEGAMAIQLVHRYLEAP